MSDATLELLRFFTHAVRYRPQLDFDQLLVDARREFHAWAPMVFNRAWTEARAFYNLAQAIAERTARGT